MLTLISNPLLVSGTPQEEQLLGTPWQGKAVGEGGLRIGGLRV